jgi:OOP family OmpA-OmpF porin
MKKIIFTFLFGSFVLCAEAQITNPKETAKRKAEDRANRGVDRTLDKGFDKVEEGIGNIFKKKEKPAKEEKKNNSQSEAQSSESSEETQKSTENTPVASKKAPVKGSSKFDFVPGEKELYFDNFERLDIGDFPAEFNTNASGEIVNIDGKEGKWLNMSKNGAFVPELIKALPENFTLEFEVGIYGKPSNNYSGFGLNFTTEADELMKDVLFNSGTSVVYLHPGAASADIQILPKNGTEINNTIPMPLWDTKSNAFARISVWRQMGRLRVYVNEDKLIDIPRFFSEKDAYSFAFFRRFFNDCDLYMTNLRYAVAGADTRNKLLTEGKFSTNEILFDVNSDKIKPESNKIITEIGNLLVENPAVKVKIIGHTDSDGDAAANLTLSKKRAESVKTRLIYGFGIDESRLSSDGKGESEPLNSNSTADEKSQNRRVEFIKQ